MWQSPVLCRDHLSHAVDKLGFNAGMKSFQGVET